MVSQAQNVPHGYVGHDPTVGPPGETVTLRDFTGQFVEALQICPDGTFRVGPRTVKAEELGGYILERVRHPARRRRDEVVPAGPVA